MTIYDLLNKQMADSGKMLGVLFAGVTEEQADQKVNEHAFSFRETIPHLTECCHAVLAHLAGEKYSWGSFKPADTSLSALIADYEATRATAVAGVLAADEAEAVEIATAYLINHDHYHVGQLCTLKMTLDPTWDAYAIYA